ncbi:MAG: arylesterase [Pseudomonadota bacterium]
MMGYICSCSNPPSPLSEGETPSQVSKEEIDVPSLHSKTGKTDTPNRRLLVIGDSLSAAYGIAPQEGWVHLLEQRLHETGSKYQIINSSISGDTTSGGHNRLAKILQQYQPSIVILELGANDGLRGLSLKAMRANLAAMIKQSQQAGARVLLLGMRIPPNYGKTYTARFHQIYYDLAATYDIALVPFFLEGVAGNRTLMQDDGIHPTAAAQERLLDNVWSVLTKEHLKQ